MNSEKLSKKITRARLELPVRITAAPNGLEIAIFAVEAQVRELRRQRSH